MNQLLNIHLTETVDTGYAVQYTNDLSVFGNLSQNRKASKQHIAKINRSMQKSGVIYSPVYVNHDMYVLDGQHRLGAVELYQKKNPTASIPYIVFANEGYGSDVIPIYNSNTDNWKTSDFIASFAERKNVGAMMLAKFLKHAKKDGYRLAPAIATILLTGKPDVKAIKNGTLNITPVAYEKGLLRFNTMLKFKDAGVSFWRSPNFVRALYRFSMNELYLDEVMDRALTVPNEVRRFIAQVEQADSANLNVNGSAKEYTKVKDYETAITNLYASVRGSHM